MRKIIIALLLLLSILFVLTQFAQVQKIWETLQRGNVWYLLLAVAFEVLWLAVLGTSYHVIYDVMGIKEEQGRVIQLAAAASFVSVIAPSGGMSGILVFLNDARNRGHSSGKVTIAGALFMLFDYAGFATILVLGFIVLYRRNHLTWTEIAASIILLLIAAGMIALLVLGMKSERLLSDVLAWLSHQVNRVIRPFIHHDYLSEDRARQFAADACEGIQAIRYQPPKVFIRPFLLALANKSIMVVIMLLMFLAFDVPVSTGLVVAGFSVGYLFLIVSPTPSGIGIVEGMLSLALSSLGVKLADAAVITLAYRGITFWLPFLVGAIAFRRIVGNKPSNSDKSI